MSADKNEHDCADRMEWLADKIPAYGDYAKEAAIYLMQYAHELRARTLQTAVPDRLDPPGVVEICQMQNNALAAPSVEYPVSNREEAASRPAECATTDKTDRHLRAEHHAIQAQDLDDPFNACMFKDTCLWLRGLALRTPPSAVADGVFVPQAAWDWLMGLGESFEPSADSKTLVPGGTIYPKYWWRSELRRRIAAGSALAPTVGARR